MPQEDYAGKQQPKDGDNNKFVGLYVLDGDGDGIFVAPSGANLRQEDDNNVADTRVQVGGEEGLGYAVGTREDVTASDGVGTHSLISLFKRFMLAWGALGDASATTDGNSSMMSFIRGIIVLINDRLPAGANTAHDAADTGNPLKIGGKAVDGTPTPVSNGDRVNVWTDLYGQVHTADDTLAAVLGQTSDLALAKDQSGTASAKLRTLTKQIGDTDDAAVTTDANGSMSAKLRGLVKWAFERMPASLGRLAAAASLSTTWSTEDKAVADAMKTALETIDNAIAGNEMQVDIVTSALPGGAATAALQSSLIALVPSSLGQKTAANSLAVTVASDQSALDVSQSKTPGTYPLIQTWVDCSGTTTYGGDPLQVPPGATSITLMADGGDARYSFVGAVSATQGIKLTAGVPVTIFALGPLPLRIYGEVGVRVYIESVYDPNIGRVINGFDLFALYPGFGWPAGNKTTAIGGRTWTVLAGTWEVSKSVNAPANSVGPTSSGATNAIIFSGPAGSFYGIHWCTMVLENAGSGRLIVGAADVDNSLFVEVFEADHATDPNVVKVVRRNAGVETVISTYSAATLAAKGLTFQSSAAVPIQVSIWTKNVSGTNRGYIRVNGVWLESPPNLTTSFISNTGTGVGTTGVSRFVSVGQCAE